MAEARAVNRPRHDFSVGDRAVTPRRGPPAIYRFACALRSASSSACTIISSVSTR
jgi:hypothetical protein